MRAETDSIAIYLGNNNAIKALNYVRKKSDSYLENKQYDAYCDIMIKKSELFRKFNDIENALNVLHGVRDIAEKNNLLEKEVLIYRGLGNLNGQILEYTKAKKYLNKAKTIAARLGNNELLLKSYQGLLKIHYDTQSDSIEYYLKKIDYYSKKSSDVNEKYKNYSNFSKYYIAQGNDLLTKKYLDSTIVLAKQTKNKDYIAATNNDFGIFYMNAEKNYQKAIQQYFEILKLYPKMDNQQVIGNAYLNISYAYDKLGDYKNALLYNEKYIDAIEGISSGRLEKINQEIETKYAINKVENEYKEKEKLLTERQARNQKILLLFASLFILAGFIFYFYYQNLLLKQKNRLKDIDSNLQFKIISATLDGQDQERNKISGILHDHVSALLSSVGLHLSAFESNLNKEQIDDLKKTRTLLKDAHDKVRDLSHELVPPLLVKLGLQFALKDLCENNSNSLLHFEFFSTLPKDRRYNPEFETKMYFIVSELLNNVIKHSNASKSKLSLEELGNMLHITIEDNGKGFEAKNISKSNGFGITQIRARVKNMNGDMEIKTKLNEGTKIIINVDL
ncbi:tetratricopeptide repeat-containing sensor histidine kinase [Flavobacterium humi]|uniref:histidine kinase n=1 Tax=Flavobacterium humi TaxID=2562683 RepID=A0A4Z0LCE7_9FLAO|nr:ATP-binding protein [Flavobacterium humi]TGD59548.1 two-component sensor histidine kinase [Flavobacterium humi]